MIALGVKRVGALDDPACGEAPPQEAGVDSWITPGAGFAIRTPTGLNVSLGITADFGDGYDTKQFRATVQLPF